MWRLAFVAAWVGGRGVSCCHPSFIRGSIGLVSVEPLRPGLTFVGPMRSSFYVVCRRRRLISPWRRNRRFQVFLQLVKTSQDRFYCSIFFFHRFDSSMAFLRFSLVVSFSFPVAIQAHGYLVSVIERFRFALFDLKSKRPITQRI